MKSLDTQAMLVYKERLRQAETRFRIVCDAMPAGLLVLSLDGTIDFINRKTEKLFRLNSAQMIGQNFSFLTEDHSPEPFLDWVQKIKEQGGQVELNARRGDGQPMVIELDLHDFEVSDKPCFLATVMDISERKEVERLRQEIIAMVSHDLATPLSSIQVTLNLLASQAAGPLNDRGMAMVQRAERSAVQLIKMINDLLSVESLEAGKVELFPQSICLQDLLADSCLIVEDAARANQIELSLKPTDIQLAADKDRLKQVVCNLLSNAIKFSPAQSTIEITASSDGVTVLVSVRDWGRGVPKKSQSRIFERFQQVELADGREKGGRGLGLAICKAIVEQHGGQIGVTEPEEGKGSIFWFKIPKEWQAASKS
jgi:PAS domain S-box-containing protein